MGKAEACSEWKRQSERRAEDFHGGRHVGQDGTVSGRPEWRAASEV